MNRETEVFWFFIRKKLATSDIFLTLWSVKPSPAQTRLYCHQVRSGQKELSLPDTSSVEIRPKQILHEFTWPGTDCLTWNSDFPHAAQRSGVPNAVSNLHLKHRPFDGRLGGSSSDPTCHGWGEVADEGGGSGSRQTPDNALLWHECKHWNHTDTCPVWEIRSSLAAFWRSFLSLLHIFMYIYIYIFISICIQLYIYIYIC